MDIDLTERKRMYTNEQLNTKRASTFVDVAFVGIKVEHNEVINQDIHNTGNISNYSMAYNSTSTEDNLIHKIKTETDDVMNQDILGGGNRNKYMSYKSTLPDDGLVSMIKPKNDDEYTVKARNVIKYNSTLSGDDIVCRINTENDDNNLNAGNKTNHGLTYNSTLPEDNLLHGIKTENDDEIETDIYKTEDASNYVVVCISSLPEDIADVNVKVENTCMINQNGANVDSSKANIKHEDMYEDQNQESDVFWNNMTQSSRSVHCSPKEVVSRYELRDRSGNAYLDRDKESADEDVSSDGSEYIPSSARTSTSNTTHHSLLKLPGNSHYISTQTTQGMGDIIIEIENDQHTSSLRHLVPVRVENKAAERSRLYRERHREEINQRRRDIRHRQRYLNQTHAVSVQQTTHESSSNLTYSHTHTQQRYYERHKEEINKRRRDNRVKQSLLRSSPATAAERNRKYRERNKHEINKRRRDSRRQKLQRIQAECNVE